MKTKLHHFCYNIDNPKELQAYNAMVLQITKNSEGRGKWMNAIGNRDFDYSEKDTTENIELDTIHLFDNQWNETTESGNRRLFDWYQEVIYNEGRKNENIKRGHWLEITPEMAQIRRVTYACGYCGKLYGPHHATSEGEFCGACLDSPYLKESELRLLRLLPVANKHGERKPLTETELAELLPCYVERQTTGADSRSAKRREKQRQDVLDEFEKDTKNATLERNGKLWLWERGFDLDNVIFYSHVQRFGFGWRKPLGGKVLDKVLSEISEFPYLYTIATEDGRKFENCE